MDKETKKRIIQIATWLIFWLLLAPTAFFGRHGLIDIDFGSNPQIALLAFPYLVIVMTYKSLFFIYRVIIDPTIIKNTFFSLGYQGIFNRFSIEYVILFALFYITVLLFINKRTRERTKAFILKLFSFPYIHALLWGTISATKLFIVIKESFLLNKLFGKMDYTFLSPLFELPSIMYKFVFGKLFDLLIFNRTDHLPGSYTGVIASKFDMLLLYTGDLILLIFPLIIAFLILKTLQIFPSLIVKKLKTGGTQNISAGLKIKN